MSESDIARVCREEREQLRAREYEQELAAVPRDIVAAIGSERIYQEQKWSGHEHVVAEWLLIMQKCLDDAKRAWVSNDGDRLALNEIRQVVAVGVACMEQCGTTFRPRRGNERE